MPYLTRCWFPLSCALLLALPLLANILLPATGNFSEIEQHSIATMPAWPGNIKEIGHAPRVVDAYADDHFGLRSQLIAAAAIAMPPALRSNNGRTIRGYGDWIFLIDDSMIQQSKGELLRRDEVKRTATVIAHIATTLHQRGIRFIFSSPPNSSTVYADKLPKWARNPGVATEYDALLAHLAAAGVPTLDLRKVLRATRTETNENLYFHQDTHWSPRGAVAAFNQIATVSGHPDWIFDASTTLGPAAPRPEGDLTRLSGDFWLPPEHVRPLLLPMPAIVLAETHNAFPSYETRDPKPVGIRLLIIGDSFTQYPFVPLDGARARQVAWTFYNRCAFDWTIVDRFKPDEVWLLPTEREMLCAAGASPVGMP